MRNLRETYNKIAERWHAEHGNDDWWVEVTDKYNSFLPSGATILDVGCGAGTKAKYLTDKGFKVTGIDFAEKMIELASSEVAEADFSVKDISEPLDFGQVFDGVFAQAVLLHIPKKDIPNVLANILAPLKDRGHFYIALKEIRPSEQEEMIVENNETYGAKYERFFSYFTLDEVRKYLIDAGLEIVYETVTTSGRRNWIQVIAQKI